ncbi:MAG: cation:proton antiporter [Candidatus Saccharimonadales bacterium]
MLTFDVYIIIAALSSLVILSYVFSLISSKTRVPTVIMLLALGIGIRELLISLDSYRVMPMNVIQFFGVLGLILILLEAGLDLKISRKKLPLVGNAAASSLFVLSLSVLGIGAIVHYMLGQAWDISFIYAVPLAVISSTIVASSIDYLSQDKREFLTYESSLSDIIGILLFNFLIAKQAFDVGVLAINILSIVLAILVSIAISVMLVMVLAKAKIKVKAFLIFAVLLLIYSVGHLWDLPALLVVLIFGLIINNWRQIKIHGIDRLLPIESVETAADSIKSVTTESAFLVRTFFFTLFGYTIDITTLRDPKVLIVGGIIVFVIFLIRFVYLRIFSSDHILPELFFAPRGLVTIVLFYSIPAHLSFGTFDEGVLFYVILLTTLIMMFGSIWFTPKDATRESEERAQLRLSRARKIARLGMGKKL